MLKVLNFRNGAVLNHHHGKETDKYLEVLIEGFCNFTDSLKVNGKTVECRNHMFKAPVRLTNKLNTISAVINNKHGKLEHSIDVIWDKKSFKRYNFFIDDNIFFLTEIARALPASLFDHFYLNKLRKIHKNYGTKFTLNIFYKNDHDDFLLKDFPDRYKAEWQANSDWLKLAFHAYSEFPDRPYQNASAEKLAADYDLIENEIIRFAGKASLQTPVVIHWAMVQPEALHILRERGVKVLSGQFIGAQTAVGQGMNFSEATDVGYYRDKETSLYLKDKSMLYDFQHDLLFAKGDITCNLLTQEQITKKIALICSEDSCKNTIGLATHEQYSFKFYNNYIEDHFDRMETAVRLLTERDYQPVFYHDGLLGNTSWK